jgi:hypothetical protein
MPVLAKDIPENDRAGFAFEIVNPELFRALDDLRIVAARLAHSGEIAFHVSHENRNSAVAEILGQGLQRHGLAGAGSSGDQAVAVRHFRQEIDRLFAFSDENWVSHKEEATLPERITGVKAQPVVAAALWAA